MSKNSKFLLRVAPLIVADAFLAVFCFTLAYMIREDATSFSLTQLRSDPNFQPYISLILFAPFVRVFSQNLFKMYEPKSLGAQSASGLVNLCKSATVGTLVLIVIAFSYRGVTDYRSFSYARLIFFFDWFLNLIMVTGVHTIIGAIQSELQNRGFGARRVAIQGAGDVSQKLLRKLANDPREGYRVMGYIANQMPIEAGIFKESKYKYLGSSHDILDIINKYSLDEVIVTNVRSLDTALMDFVEECHKRDVVVKLHLDFYGILTQSNEIEDLGGHPVVQVNEIAIVGFARVLKRMEDILLSTVLLCITFPVWIMVAALIKRESPGPIIFQQQRVGKNGRTFTMLKFRSMCNDAEERKKDLEALNEADGHIFKMKADPRVTRVGRMLRRTNLDELPQFLNVLRGDMSLVGPRPPVPGEVAKYTEKQKRRLGATPGITGMWQVNRSADEHSFDEVISWDIYYIEHWSLWLDIKILFKTVWVVMSGKGSY